KYIEKNGNINYIQSEQEIACRLKFGNHTFNFTYIIDRLEATCDNSMLRIIDYKTGKDNPRFKTIDALFDPKCSDRRKAALQLLLYCYAYEQCDKRPVQPLIYKVANINDSGLILNKNQITYPRFSSTDSKDNVTNYEVRKDFVERMDEVINGIFDPDKPFAQTQNKEKNCEYCKFKEFCRVE
ncbi:MAG: PD-(D/E)XK nuclease family protein, partial [Muribaculaceae bacterium]